MAYRQHRQVIFLFKEQDYYSIVAKKKTSNFFQWREKMAHDLHHFINASTDRQKIHDIKKIQSASKDKKSNKFATLDFTQV